MHRSRCRQIWVPVEDSWLNIRVVFKRSRVGNHLIFGRMRFWRAAGHAEIIEDAIASFLFADDTGINRLYSRAQQTHCTDVRGVSFQADS